MSFPLPRPSEKSKSGLKKTDESPGPRESDPLLLGSGDTNQQQQGVARETHGGSIRVRKSSRSPVHSTPYNQQYQPDTNRTRQEPMLRPRVGDDVSDHDGYESIDEPTLNMRQRTSMDDEESRGSGRQSAHSQRTSSTFHGNSPADGSRRSVGSGSQPPPLEIPQEIYAVRTAALQVFKPLTKTWVVVSVGFALTVLFGMAKWTRLMPSLPFWFILLPCWSAHGGLVFLHVMSAQALSTFIAQANESRQRPDSRDHLNRTEYLPLLQRSLKFGLKTGLLSLCFFVFEILIYVRLARRSLSLAAALVPMWLLVSGGIADGLICKTQHLVRVSCWILTFVAMLLTVLKVDYSFDSIRWRMIMFPILAVLTVVSGSLIYIVYGHQIGYYRLSEAQLTAGNLYSLAALICIVLVVMIGEVMPLSRPVEVESRVFVVVLAPLVVCMVGMGAWVVSRDEFGRLLLYGGQSAVHPMKLRWEARGWTSVQGKGVTTIPMFGEVNFQPLEKKASDQALEMWAWLPGTCYPYEEEEESAHVDQDFGYHPYLDSSPARSARKAYNVLRGTT